MSSSIFNSICSRVEWCRREVLDAVLELAVEIAREGREGRRIGTLFTLGHAEAVLSHSRPLILDPLSGHAPTATHVTDANLRGTVKELAQLDGAFVVSETGIVVAACRYLDASVEDIDLPLGLGSRHLQRRPFRSVSALSPLLCRKARSSACSTRAHWWLKSFQSYGGSTNIARGCAGVCVSNTLRTSPSSQRTRESQRQRKREPPELTPTLTRHSRNRSRRATSLAGRQ
jgi:hypothetical protein